VKVLVTGGTGFVGTHLVNALLRRRHDVAVLARDGRATRNRYNQKIETVEGNVLDPASLAAACSERDAVIHLVAIIDEEKGQTFEQVHHQAVENLVKAMVSAGVRRLLHMSAMGVAPDAPSLYARTKAAGESTVRSSGLAWTIFRPSVIFGPGDGFFSLLAGVVRGNPGFIPIIGPGTTRFQPISVYDVARVFTEALEKPETSGRAFDLGGPEVFTLNELYREVAIAVGKARKPVVHLPLWWGALVARAFEGMARRGWLESPPLTRDQLKSLSRDNVADISEALRVFGGEWKKLRVGLREYLHGAMKHDPRFGQGNEVDLEPVKVLRIQ